LLLILGIVEDHENPSVGEQRAEQSRLGVQILRHPIRP
jgi:hypothetical protein